jgi:hypothetical protein
LTKFKSDLKNDLKTAAEANSKNDVTLDQALERLANVVADNVDAYIRTMTITIASGLVQVQGSPSAQTNATPIVITNGIS